MRILQGNPPARLGARRLALLAALSATLSAPLLSPLAAAEPPAPDAKLTQRLERYLQPLIDDRQLSGCLLLARGPDIVFERSFGMANFELNVPNTAETRFNIASIAKPMTIALVCRLVDEGKLRPDQTVAQWIPDFPRGEQITVSHLLNHRAGIPHRVTTDREETRPMTAQDMVALAAKSTFLFDPGTRSVYSSAGYSVLARIVELAAGEDYGQALADRVLRPAGLTATQHADSRTIVPQRASSYLAAMSGPENAPLKDLSFLVGAGSVVSTPRDLFALMRAILDGKLGETAKSALLRGDGLHWNGNTNGFRAFADYDAQRQTTVVFLANLHTGAADLLQRDLPKLLAGEEVASPPRLALAAVAIPDSVLKRYEGTYRSENGQEWPLRVRDGVMVAGERTLVPRSATKFFSLADYGEVTIAFAPNGAVDRLDWLWQGQTLKFQRVGDVTADSGG